MFQSHYSYNGALAQNTNCNTKLFVAIESAEAVPALRINMKRSFCQTSTAAALNFALERLPLSGQT